VIPLLRRLLPSRDIDALLGDITEEARRRSRVWYWTQILAVVLVASGRDVRRHPWIALRAVAAGIASLIVYFYALNALANSLTYLNSGFYVGSHFIHWSPRWGSDRIAIELFLVTVLSLLLVGPVASGWIVGRLHRAHGIAMVLCFSAFMALLSGTLTIRAFLLTSAWTPFDVARMSVDVAVLLVAPSLIAVGGFWSTRPAEPTQ
jgi:hypothetical protein